MSTFADPADARVTEPGAEDSGRPPRPSVGSAADPLEPSRPSADVDAPSSADADPPAFTTAPPDAFNVGGGDDGATGRPNSASPAGGLASSYPSPEGEPSAISAPAVAPPSPAGSAQVAPDMRLGDLITPGLPPGEPEARALTPEARPSAPAGAADEPPVHRSDGRAQAPAEPSVSRTPPVAAPVASLAGIRPSSAAEGESQADIPSRATTPAPTTTAGEDSFRAPVRLAKGVQDRDALPPASRFPSPTAFAHVPGAQGDRAASSASRGPDTSARTRVESAPRTRGASSDGGDFGAASGDAAAITSGEGDAASQGPDRLERPDGAPVEGAGVTVRNVRATDLNASSDQSSIDRLRPTDAGVGPVATDESGKVDPLPHGSRGGVLQAPLSPLPRTPLAPEPLEAPSLHDSAGLAPEGAAATDTDVPAGVRSGGQPDARETARQREAAAPAPRAAPPRAPVAPVAREGAPDQRTSSPVASTVAEEESAAPGQVAHPDQESSSRPEAPAAPPPNAQPETHQASGRRSRPPSRSGETAVVTPPSSVGPPRGGEGGALSRSTAPEASAAAKTGDASRADAPLETARTSAGPIAAGRRQVGTLPGPTATALDAAVDDRGPSRPTRPPGAGDDPGAHGDRRALPEADAEPAREIRSATVERRAMRAGQGTAPIRPRSIMPTPPVGPSGAAGSAGSTPPPHVARAGTDPAGTSSTREPPGPGPRGTDPPSATPPPALSTGLPPTAEQPPAPGKMSPIVPPPAVAPAKPRRGGDGPPAPIRITIGRITVADAPKPATRTGPRRPGPTLSLADYLRRRRP
jgi:hypothetical protein